MLRSGNIEIRFDNFFAPEAPMDISRWWNHRYDQGGIRAPAWAQDSTFLI
jgi:hypothetical protein